MEMAKLPQSARLRSRWSRAFLILAAILAFPQRGVSDDSLGPGERLSRRAEQMMSTMKGSEYAHQIHIDEEAGFFQTDCSGLIRHLIQKEAAPALISLVGDEAPWRSRPLAVTFYETIIRAGTGSVDGWKKINRLADAKPGDIIAWRKDKLEKGSTTGHVLLVVNHPVIEVDGRYRVRVFDSTRSIHAEDTRPDGSAGVGTGTMWFEVNETGAPVRYFVDDERKPGSSTRIAVGRLLDPVEKKD